MTESNASSLDLRDWTFPEEERHLYTSAPWRGEYRWFRSSNVVPLAVAEEARQPTKHGKPARCQRALDHTLKNFEAAEVIRRDRPPRPRRSSRRTC